MRLPIMRTVVALGLLLGATAALPQGTTPMFGGLMDDTNDPLEILALVLERTTATDGAQVLLFTGSVVAIRGDMEIRADSLRILVPEGAENRFERLEANGNVVVISGTQRASASRAVMDMAQQTITMTGNVQLSDGANQMNGETFTVDLETGMWRLEAPNTGRVQTVITPGARN